METETKTKPVEVAVQKVQRNKKGQFLQGTACPNHTGRPRLGQTSLDKLLQAISRVESTKNKRLLDFYIERCFKSDPVLISVMKKLLPDLQAIAALTIDQQMDDAMALSIQKEMQKRFKA